MPTVEDSFMESLISSEHEELLLQLKVCLRTPQHARDLALRRFLKALCRHGEMESALLFDGLSASAEGCYLAAAAEREERDLERWLKPISLVGLPEGSWENYLGEMHEAIRAHFDREETELLPRARTLYDDREWKRVGLLYAFVEQEGVIARANQLR